MLRSFTLEVTPEHKPDYEQTLAWLRSAEGQALLAEFGRDGLVSYSIVQRTDLAFDVDLEAENDNVFDSLRADARVWPLTWVPRAPAAASMHGDPEAPRQVRFEWRRKAEPYA